MLTTVYDASVTRELQSCYALNIAPKCMNSPSPITLRPVGRLLIASLNRPPDNLINEPLAEALRDLCATLREDSPFDALILTGHDPESEQPEGDGANNHAFSRGADPEMGSADAPAGHAAALAIERRRCATAISGLPIPIIAAVNGDAFDQGLELALAADIRVASESARFRMGQVAAGAIPWDGGTQRLPRCVGPARATDLILTCRDIGASEAMAMGLVNRVARDGETLNTAEEIAAQILAGGPIAARYAKEVVSTGTEMTLEQGILLETDLTMILQTTQDRQEGINSFLERRDPEYRGE